MNRAWNRLRGLPVKQPLCLTFAPLAFLKLQFSCHVGPTEVGGFGITAANDPLYVEDWIPVEQWATLATVRFGDQAVADFFDRCVDARLTPDRYGKIWCHTHPAESVTPSPVDETTFARSFGACDWAVMFILGRTGRTYARLAFNAGPGAALEIPTAVDWTRWPETLTAKDKNWTELVAAWRDEYARCVHVIPDLVTDPGLNVGADPFFDLMEWDDLSGMPEWDAVRYEPVLE